jgi:hypothetical protein
MNASEVTVEAAFWRFFHLRKRVATILTGSGMKMSQAMFSLLARLETLVQREAFRTVDPSR